MYVWVGGGVCLLQSTSKDLMLMMLEWLRRCREGRILYSCFQAGEK